MPIAVLKLDHLVLTVADIEATADWYSRVLGVTARRWRHADGTKRASLYWTDEMIGNDKTAYKINLHRAGSEYEPHAARPTPGSADLCFICYEAMSVVLARLAACGVPIEMGPVWREGARDFLYSVYVRDPDGNLIELSEPGPGRNVDIEAMLGN